MRRRSLTTVVTGAVVLSSLLAPAVAMAADGTTGNGGDTGAGCAVDECQVGAGRRVPGSHGEGVGGSSSNSHPSLRCLYFASEADTATGALALESFTPGDTVWVRCWSDSEYTVPYGSAWSIVWQADTPAQPALPVEDVAQWAFERMHLPVPAPGFNPGGTQVVNLPTWLWVDQWTPVSQTATAGGVSATVTATPWRQRWDFGADGASAICLGPGTAYNPALPERAQHTSCSATFTHTSHGQPGGAFTVAVTVDWRVSWTSTVAGRGGDLGVLSTTATRQAQVGEIQVLNS